MAHYNYAVDFTVDVYVVYNNKVLLRKHDKYGIWLGVGGHIDLDEDPNQAAIREVMEEVGLSVTLYDSRSFTLKTKSFTELITPQHLNIHDINETHRHIGMVYFAESSSSDVVENDREKSKGYQWLTQGEVKSLDCKPEVKEYALGALEAYKQT